MPQKAVSVGKSFEEVLAPLGTQFDVPELLKGLEAPPIPAHVVAAQAEAELLREEGFALMALAKDTQQDISVVAPVVFALEAKMLATEQVKSALATLKAFTGKEGSPDEVAYRLQVRNLAVLAVLAADSYVEIAERNQRDCGQIVAPNLLAAMRIRADSAGRDGRAKLDAANALFEKVGLTSMVIKPKAK